MVKAARPAFAIGAFAITTPSCSRTAARPGSSRRRGASGQRNASRAACGTTSNVLTIGANATRLGPGTIVRRAVARASLTSRDLRLPKGVRRSDHGPSLRWRRAARMHRARRLATETRDLRGRRPRRSATTRALSPESGARIVMPCAHASWFPTRGAGQTTGTQISRLSANGNDVWLTGTSALASRCSSPFRWACWVSLDTGPPPNAHSEGASLFWRGERLHRTVLRDYEVRRAAFEPARAELGGAHDPRDLGRASQRDPRLIAARERHAAASPPEAVRSVVAKTIREGRNRMIVVVGAGFAGLSAARAPLEAQ